MLQLLDANPGRWNLSQMKGMLVGGAAVPRSLIAAYKERHGLSIVQGWGMTETSPVASETDFIGDLRGADDETKFDVVAMAGLPLPFVEVRVRDDEGRDVEWDGEAMGELEVRGPWVASGYYDTPEQADRWTDDGWFRTGDIVSMHPRGFIQIKDRAKDVIKSGGEWISSVELENALMAHPAVAEAAVIAIPDEKWTERPLAVVVAEGGRVGDCGRASRVPGAELREVVAARSHRVRGRDPEDRRRQVPQDRAPRAVRRDAGRGPRSLKAVLLRETGGPERLEIAEVPDPEPGDGEVLVRVRASGINFLDVLVRQGRYAQQPELPLVPGDGGRGRGRRPPRDRAAATPGTRSSPSRVRSRSFRCRTGRPSRRAPRS